MNKLFRLSCVIILFHQIIIGNQEPWPKMQCPNFDSDVQILESEYVGDGFLQGTLIETIKGYVPIEQIEVGDYLLGIEGVQEVLSVKKGKVNLHVKLLMSNGEYVHAAMHQDFYLDDKELHPAADLCLGYRLFNGLYIVDHEFIHGLCNCYSLTTEHHAYFIYPEMLVHNFNPVVVGALGSYVIGTIEVSNVVNVILGAIASLSWYASQYFRSTVVYNYEFTEEDSKLTIEKLCLQNSDVVQQTRNYFDTKRRLLNNLHQDLIKVKNDVSAFVRPSSLYVFDFSIGLLSQFKPAIYNASTLIPFTSEMALSLADKEKLMKKRQAELDKLQQDIFDTHLTLILHIVELIDRRDLARQQLDDVSFNGVNEIVSLWNEDLYNISIGTAFVLYKVHFCWKEMLDNFEFKIKELNFVMSYYEKMKSHFFMTKTTNFIDIFKKQAGINKANLERIEKSNAIWWSNMKIIENFLKERNLLTKKLVDEYKLIGKQYRIERDRNPIVFAQKRIEDIKKQINKESDDTKKGGGGGGPEDPEDPEDPNDKFKKVFTHAFTGAKGHLIDTPANRILILEMASNIKNYITKDVHGNFWYAKILENGAQLWAWARDGLIRDCGINEIPRVITKYGLCKDISIK